MSKPEGYSRIIAAHINDMKRSLGALLGIAQGLLCDRHLSDQEIQFLNERLSANDEIAAAWPGGFYIGGYAPRWQTASSQKLSAFI